ncbi:protein-disulfide reductase DsbD family protein [Mucilaginibacter sp. SP1R1]|uniref:protein-disulfide reductase DsbD family protein n=1 Tax=Mucilaginibacter sp. SP1R1 TaxID=2723091 RepID=UPI00161AED16|nr:cytochrome c biogenesis protein CcdA [Mucilaginibacter sp. SP1R1]MBB6150116.1 thiol:disulfide interchange protein DsbD [Mucilaginibacter sp. SP1R1]
MKLFNKTNWLPSALAIVTVLIIFGINAPKPVYAEQKSGRDTTVSTGDLQFTDIPTAADSIAIRKKAADSAAKAAAAKPAAAKPGAAENTPSSEKPKTLWQIFIFGLLGGFTAVILPCIYPLLPLTISFFTKKSGSRQKAIGQSLIYGASIIVIYVTLGLLISIIFGSDALNQLATNGIFNIFFFLLLIVFGISFLGAFEITLPSSLANKLDENADKGGLAGIFFMASTLVVVSFSCTGPIIGTLLVDAASKGDRLGPAIGMFGFSLALALPFTIFALFPSALKSLPKSGGWLNSVKVVLGFLELAFALKFLSNVDLAYHWNWFDREIFLSLWIAIGLLMGLYLIGKIKFSHDSDVPYLTIPRTFLAIVVFAFVIYMVPGLWGAPLKSISAFLPPEATQDFNLSSIPDGAGASSGAAATTAIPASIGERKYVGSYTRITTRGLDAWYDYDQALLVSKVVHKPILIDFTGFNCVNCRKMEANVWSDPEVFKRLKNNFVLLQLVVDDKAALQPQEQFVSDYSGKKITTLGGKWSDLEAKRFNSNSQPLYVMLDSDGNFLKDASGKDIPTSPADYDIASYIKFLDSGIAAFKK